MSVTCEQCSQEIKERVFVTLSSGVYYHTAHFRCSVCENNLSEKPYFKKSKKYYCEDDYHKLFSPYCEVCKTPIKEQYITALGKPFHIEHFNCMKCHNKFEDGQFYKVDNQAFCKQCYANFAAICAFCQKFIIEKIVTLFHKTYHKECIHCSKCNGTDFNEDLYYERKEKIYHEQCYKDLYYEKCCLCKNYCESDFLRIEEKPFHQECLELYKDYAKKLIEEELNGQGEEKQEEPEMSKDDILGKNEEKKLDLPLNQPELIRPSILRSSIRKPISSTKVTFIENEGESSNDVMEEIVLTKDMTTRIENKIRNSIKLIENDIKTFDIGHKKVSTVGKASILKFNNQKKESKPGYSYNMLKQGPYPPEIDTTKREIYLNDEDFENHFKMTKSQFFSMPKWRQVDLKKKLGLF